jgi:hypothetical protein
VSGRPVAERIAEVVADIRSGRTNHPAATDKAGMLTSLEMLERAQRPQPVVDCTAIFNLQRVAARIDLYDDHPSIVPPWVDALLCYANTFGNIICLQVHRKDWDGTTPDRVDWMTDNDVDWQRVRWVAETAIWVGGVSGDGQPISTSGPCHMFRHAIHDDGSPADINWLALMARRGQFGKHSDIDDANLATWEAAMVTVGASLNFLNGSNVDVAEPARPRPERRRIARTGVAVQTIVVRPPGKRRDRSGAARPIDAAESVLSPVRGHWARYGPGYNRGLLFGKYHGKFWIPGHVRGACEGENPPDQRTYLLRPQPSRSTEPERVK